MDHEKFNTWFTACRACGFAAIDLHSGFFIYYRLYHVFPSSVICLYMVTARVYIINRLRFYSFGDAVKYAAGCGLVVTGWRGVGLYEIILTVVPATVGHSVTNISLYEKNK